MLKKHRGLGVIVFLAGLAAIASAQTYQGRISGTITDKTGAVVSGATVVDQEHRHRRDAYAHYVEQRRIRRTEFGSWLLTSLPPTAPGFKRVERAAFAWKLRRTCASTFNWNQAALRRQ